MSGFQVAGASDAAGRAARALGEDQPTGADTAAAACEPDGVGFDAGTLLLPADVGDSALVGAEVAAAGDVDGDGFGDVLVTQVTPPAVRLHRGEELYKAPDEEEIRQLR